MPSCTPVFRRILFLLSPHETDADFFFVVSLEPSDRPCRLYHVRSFGEPVEQIWVEDRATQTFYGGFEFEQLPPMRRRGKQREQMHKHTVITT